MLSNNVQKLAYLSAGVPDTLLECHRTKTLRYSNYINGKEHLKVPEFFNAFSTASITAPTMHCTTIICFWLIFEKRTACNEDIQFCRLHAEKIRVHSMYFQEQRQWLPGKISEGIRCINEKCKRSIYADLYLLRLAACELQRLNVKRVKRTTKFTAKTFTR